VSEPIRSSAEAAQHFAEAVVAAVFAPWADDLVDRAGLQPGQWALDVACGTGAVARVAAVRVGPSGAVAALDADASRIAVAEALPPPSGAPITWHHGDADAMSFTDALFDVVFCQQALHLMQDRTGALREMHRVLVPGGRLAVSVWRTMEESPGYLAFATAVRRHVDPDQAGQLGRQFTLSDPDELRDLLRAAGFASIEIVSEVKVADFADPEDFIRYQMDGNSRRWNLNEEAREKILADIRAELTPFVDNGRLRFPRGANIALARRP
jgi:ubiquinone/menaquinone biosynthesis C-methylase UbiE